MFVDRAVDTYDPPHANLCGDCEICLRACPTKAFPAPGVVDARRCVSYQSIENHIDVPTPLRRGFRGRVFGCDVCQDVCPFNQRAEVPPADPRFAARPISGLAPAELAALSRDEFERLAAGTALARAQYDGLRRSALLALGAGRNAAARPVVERLTGDPSPVVREAAVWALGRITRRAEAGPPPEPIAGGSEPSEGSESDAVPGLVTASECARILSGAWPSVRTIRTGISTRGPSRKASSGRWRSPRPSGRRCTRCCCTTTTTPRKSSSCTC